MPIAPRNTTQNSSKHAISSEKFIFFWAGVKPPNLNPSPDQAVAQILS